MWVMNIFDDGSMRLSEPASKLPWRNSSLPKATLCSVLTCGQCAEVFGEVQKVGFMDPNHYVIGLCRGHKRQPGLIFEVSDGSIQVRSPNREPLRAA